MKTSVCRVAIIIICALFSSIGKINAQAPNWLWAKSAGGTNYDEARSVATDVSGNVYTVGFFQSTSINFGTNTLTNLSQNSNADMFIVKHDANGNALWAQRAGGTSWDEASSVTTDALGNIYVVGWFGSSTITFGSTTLNGSVNGSNVMFIVKYNSAGLVLWARKAGGSSDDYAYSVTSDPTGNVYVAGSFQSAIINFGATSLTNAIANGSNPDVFLVKYDANGNDLWAKRAGGVRAEEAISVTADASGNIYIVGWFADPTIAFGSVTLTNADGTGQSSDVFIVKYDPGGNELWGKSAGAMSNGFSYNNSANSVTTDASGNVYVSGIFGRFGIIFGSIVLTNSSSSGRFLVKYDSSGQVTWANKASGITAVTTDAIGNIYSAGSSSTFIVKYNSDGNILWSKSAGAIAYSLSVDVSGKVYLAGSFSNPTVVFGCTTLSNTNPTGNITDLFIVSVNSSFAATSATITANGSTALCSGDSVTLTANNASSYLWSNGATSKSITVKTTGNYSVAVSDANNCVVTSSATPVIMTYCTVNIDLKAFIEGFYISGTDSMLAVVDRINYPTACDTVTLLLADSASHQIVASDKKVISTQGRGTFNFTGLLPGHRYYLVIRHRQSLETWSKYSFLFDNPVLNIDFTR